MEEQATQTLYYLAFRDNVPYSFTHIIKGTTFKIYLKYDNLADRYYIDIYRLENNEYVPKVYGLYLTTGANIVSQYQYLDLGQLYIVPKTDEYYGFLETGKINVEGSIETTYGSYPTADTIVDGFMMMWQHE